MDPATIISLAIGAATQAVRLVSELRNEARRTGAWTPEQEAEFDKLMLNGFKAPHWQPDASESTTTRGVTNH